MYLPSVDRLHPSINHTDAHTSSVPTPILWDYQTLVFLTILDDEIEPHWKRILSNAFSQRCKNDNLCDYISLWAFEFLCKKEPLLDASTKIERKRLWVRLHQSQANVIARTYPESSITTQKCSTSASSHETSQVKTKYSYHQWRSFKLLTWPPRSLPSTTDTISSMTTPQSSSSTPDTVSLMTTPKSPSSTTDRETSMTTSEPLWSTASLKIPVTTPKSLSPTTDRKSLTATQNSSSSIAHREDCRF